MLYQHAVSYLSKWRSDKQSRRTDASNFLNSASLAFLYSSISFVASERASFSFCTRSSRDLELSPWGNDLRRTLASFLYDFGSGFLGLEKSLDTLRLLSRLREIWEMNCRWLREYAIPCWSVEGERWIETQPQHWCKGFVGNHIVGRWRAIRSTLFKLYRLLWIPNQILRNKQTSLHRYESHSKPNQLQFEFWFQFSSQELSTPATHSWNPGSSTCFIMVYVVLRWVWMWRRNVRVQYLFFSQSKYNHGSRLLVSSQTLETLFYLLDDPNPATVKVVTQCLATVYPLLFRSL